MIAALPLDLAAELLSETLDQPAPQSGVNSLLIDPTALAMAFLRGRPRRFATP
jgi:hypothetical protein